MIPLTEEWLRENVWPRFSRVLGSNRSIYLANHSLGRPLDQTALDVQEGLDLWYDRLDGAWDDDAWPAEIERFRRNIATLIGAPSPQNIIPKTSAGQGLRAVLNSFARVPRVLATRGEFDSIDLILKAYTVKERASVQWIDPEPGVPAYMSLATVLQALDEDADLLVISHIFFSTGQIMPGLKEIIEKAHSRKTRVLVDAYHSAGVIPFSFQEMAADFMIGGSYKYFRGGPGACWLALSDECRSTLRTLDTGWFAKKDPFNYARPDPPEYSEAWLESTPPVLTMYQARAGLELTLELGVERLREYNLAQQETLRSAFRLNGVKFVDSDLQANGAFTLISASDAPALSRALSAKGVITDARGATVRFGPDILNSSQELSDAARICADVLTTI